jgi:hypothetical protein
MDDIVHHLRDIAEHRKAADNLRAKVLLALQDLEDIRMAASYGIELDDIETKAARAIETIADLSQRIEELGQ